MTELMHSVNNQSEPLIPETPYLRAKEEWDTRIGSSIIQAYNWRKMAFIGAITVVILVIALSISQLQPKYIPYIIEVSDTQVTQMSKMSNNYQIKDTQIKYYLIKFVEKIRGISIDNEVNKKWLMEAYSFLTPKTANKFDGYFTSNDNPIFSKLQNLQSVFVVVTSFTAINNNVYQLQWLEETHDQTGKLITKEKFVGFATIKISPPVHEKTILQNPLGIWITDFSWSKVMTDE